MNQLDRITNSHDRGLTRRHFVVTSLTAAGGFAIAVSTPELARALALSEQPWSPENPSNELSPWIVIASDNVVTIRIPHAEMGQGAATALPMIVAEELECDWAQIKGEFASGNRNVREKGVYKDMATSGSRGVRTSWQYLQQAGASARVRLIEAAAKRWGVAAADCVARQGKVLHQASNRSLDFGALAADAAMVTLATEPAIKSPDQYKLIGTSVARLDTPLKINGSARFGIDTRLPGMLYAAISACPVFGGKVGKVDKSAIAGLRGIEKVVKLDDAVAVVADRYWRAKRALLALKIEWDVGASGNANSTEYAKLYRDTLNGPMVTARNDGNIEDVLAKGSKVIEATYEVPHLAHAPLEPMNATVDLQSDRLDIWIGTQHVMSSINMAAAASGLKSEQIYLHNAYLGGGFGRRGTNDELPQAIHVAKAVGKPVKLVWTREEDMQHDRYRPQAAARFRGVLGPDNKPIGLEARLAVPSLLRSHGFSKVENGIEPMAVECISTTSYRIQNLRVGVMLKNTHVPVSFWRSVGASQNAFFIESFVDELAYTAGQDPYQYRRAMLDRPDFLGVLDTLAEKSGWREPLAAGRGRGMAIVECYNSISGQVAEVTVSPRGEVKVDRVVAAVDCGHAVNPKIIEAQMEGGIIYGLSAALFGEITIKDGRVEQTNFDAYEVVKIDQAPKIEVYLALSGGNKWGGIGEPGTAPIAPAVANAIFAATGKRVRSLPLKNATLV